MSMPGDLADLGRLCFGVIAQSTRNNDRTAARLDGIRDALALRGLTVRPPHFVTGEWSIAEGRSLFRGVMATDPLATTVICCNTHLAVGAMLGGAGCGGLKIPEALSIAGYDDIEIMSHLPAAPRPRRASR